MGRIFGRANGSCNRTGGIGEGYLRYQNDFPSSSGGWMFGLKYNVSKVSAVKICIPPVGRGRLNNASKIELKASRVSMMSQPDKVTNLILSAGNDLNSF
jgi:hypothetical protein